VNRILIVDDDRAVLFSVDAVLRDRGHLTVTANSGAEALSRLQEVEGVAAVVTDFAMDGMDGLSLLRAVHERDASLPVILLTAQGNERVAVEAMKGGAFDYVTKPFDIDELGLLVDRAIETRQLRLENQRLKAEAALGHRLVAESAAMRQLLEAVARVAEKDVTVLLRGETGTGKELIASLIHAQSRRAARPLVRFNCAAIPDELADAELFGHARGAFTGAVASRRGFFAQAHEGTLFLDEVGELPMGVQPKLLRAIQEGEIQPVGSGKIERVDVRLVAASNRDLAAESARGVFRADLYYRLAVVELTVPTLRQRRADIPMLSRELAKKYATKFGLPGLELSEALLARLCEADWPGNVRQLENTVARMAALSTGGVLGPDVFDARDGFDGAPPDDAGGHGGVAMAPAAGADAPPQQPLNEQIDALERAVITRTLAETSGNQSEAARRLGLSRATLFDRLKRYRGT
jgi:DNA-binding NtrC family response regulator